MPDHSQSGTHPANRRLAILRLGLLLGVLGLVAAGCDRGGDSEPAAESGSTPVSTVPLRIVSAAQPDVNQRLQTAWSTISEQPIELVEVQASKLLEKAATADVVIFENLQMGDLQANNLLAPLPEVFLSSTSLDQASFLPSLATDSMRWGTDVFALPLGTAFPAVWFTRDVNLSDAPTWDEYSAELAKVAPGEAAEPLADGWAAAAFLWRSASMTGEMWLFDRQSFKPVIDSPPYLRALQQMVDARPQYPEKRLTPTEVWAQLNEGKLKLAIGWPTTNLNDAALTGDATVGATTGGTQLDEPLALAGLPTSDQVFLGDWRPLVSPDLPAIPALPPVLSPHGLSVAMASSCRQTAVARTFTAWLAGREGHASVRGALGQILPNRQPLGADDENGTSGSNVLVAVDAERTKYDNYLQNQLMLPAVRPSLRLPRASEYLAVLDRHVIAALEGQATPEESLKNVADEWEQITESAGRRQQLNGWRQAQGMRER